MKTILRHVLVIALTTLSVRAEEEAATLPPKDLRAEWADLEDLKFSSWSIKNFHGWAIPFDGGSKVFFFESASGERFDVVAANPGYWTDLEKKRRQQVFFVVYKKHFYRIEPKSDEQKNLIEKLTKAAKELVGEDRKDPKLLNSLAELLESRAPIFKL